MEQSRTTKNKEHARDILYAFLFGVDRTKLRRCTTIIVDGKAVTFDERGNKIKRKRD